LVQLFILQDFNASPFFRQINALKHRNAVKITSMLNKKKKNSRNLEKFAEFNLTL